MRLFIVLLTLGFALYACGNNTPESENYHDLSAEIDKIKENIDRTDCFSIRNGLQKLDKINETLSDVHLSDHLRESLQDDIKRSKELYKSNYEGCK